VTELTEAKIALERRLSALLGGHDVHPDDRSAIQTAFEAAGSFEELPTEIQARIIELEGELPPQSWDDPSDVPENLDELS
jgi:hypothetical protein